MRDDFPDMGTAGKPKREPKPGPHTWASSAAWAPAAIPPRPWVAKGYLLRGAVTAVVGAGGVSKSALMLAYAVAGAQGMEYHGMKPAERFRTLIYNAEDDDDEQQRRLTAALTRLGKRPEDIAEWVMRCGPEGAATLLARDPDTKALERTGAMDELIANARAFKADVLILDPMAEMHTEEENANVALREVVAEFRSVARELNLALVLVHHTRKGMVVPGDMDAARGASSVVSAARIGLTVVGMTADDAKAFGLPLDAHRHYFRLDGGKANYSSLTECEWFERSHYELEQGDDAAVPVPWTPPVDVLSLDMRAQLEAALRGGGPGGPWSPKLENRPRSVKHPLVEAGIITQPGQRDVIAALHAEGWVSERFRDTGRKWALGIRSPDGFPAAEWFVPECEDEPE